MYIFFPIQNHYPIYLIKPWYINLRNLDFVDLKNVPVINEYLNIWIVFENSASILEIFSYLCGIKPRDCLRSANENLFFLLLLNRSLALSNASRVAHVAHQPAYRRFACRRTDLRIVGNGGKVMRVNETDLFTKQ